MSIQRLVPGYCMVNFQGVSFQSPDMTGRFEGMHHECELD